MAQNSGTGKSFAGLTLHLSGARWVMVGAAVLVIAGAVTFILVRDSSGSQYQGASVNTQAPNVQNTPGKSSPQYAKEVDSYNQRQGQAAENSGKSFFAVPVTSVTSATFSAAAPATAKTDSSQRAQQQAAMNRYNQSFSGPARNPAQPAPEDAAVAQEIKLIGETFAMGGGAPALVPVMQQQGEMAGGTGKLNWQGAGQASAGQASSPSKKKTYVVPDAGDIIYGVMDMEADSSVTEAPVMATLLQAPFLKEKVLGKITKPKGVNRLVIRFNTLVLPDGQTQGIDAYAVAPKTTLPEMATSVNEHILARTGAFLGSVFLAGVEGYGQAVAQQGETVNNGLIGTSTTYNSNLSPAQLNAIAAGSAARDLQPLNQAFSNTLTEPNTVKVAAGTPFDLFVVKGAGK